MRCTAAELSAENGRALLIPEGVAHGFLTLEPDTDVLYQISPMFEPGHEAGVDGAVGMAADAVEEGQPAPLQFPRKFRLPFGILFVADEAAVWIAGGDPGATVRAVLPIEVRQRRAGDAHAKHERFRRVHAIVGFQVGLNGRGIDF